MDCRKTTEDSWWLEENKELEHQRLEEEKKKHYNLIKNDKERFRKKY